MNEWIEINLPFKKYIYEDNNDQFPDLSERMKSIFGKTEEELDEEVSFESRNSVSDLIEDKTKEEIEVLIETNLLVAKVLCNKKNRKQMNDWLYDQPEAIAWNERADRRNIERKNIEATISFCGAKLNKSGTLIEVEEDGKFVKYLIGNINESGGLCDDCHIPDDVIVKRYKIVYEKE